MCLYPKKIPILSKRKPDDSIFFNTIYKKREDLAIVDGLPMLSSSPRWNSYKIETIPIGETRFFYEGLVKCGNCLECMEQQSTEWAFRVMDECSCHLDNCVITLTYNNEHLPQGGNLCRKDLQDFVKRLRKFISPQKIRIFYCGEYGSHHQRPHYHIIIFGFKPNDLVHYKTTKKGSKLYKSAFIDSLWKLGFADIGEVDFTTAKYSAKYLQKLQQIPDDMVQPFVGMSNRPGIGYLKIKPSSLNSDKIYQNGQYIKIPRYYLKKLEEAGYNLDDVISLRLSKALQFELSDDELRVRREQARKKLLDIYLNPL